VRGNGNVYWARTGNWSYRGIAANRGSSMSFTVPSNIPPDNYLLYAVSCGQASQPVAVNVASSAGGESIFMRSY